jgi:hypothetical protein
MRTYHVEPSEHRSRVVETMPDGSKVVIGTFPSAGDARFWIDQCSPQVPRDPKP